jgi:hypothetical protein
LANPKKPLFFFTLQKNIAMPIPPYAPHGLDDSRFHLTGNALAGYKNLLSGIGDDPPGDGLSILLDDIYEPENFQSLGLVAFFSQGQIESLFDQTPDATLRPDAVGLIAALGFDTNQNPDKLILIIAPSDEVGRIISAENSFDQNAVRKWELGGNTLGGTAITMQEYQTLRDNFMRLTEFDLRYAGFEKLKSLTPGNVEFSVNGKTLFDIIFENNPVDPQVTTTAHVAIRDDDDHPLLANTPAKYLTMAVSRNNPLVAYSGRATPTYTVYNNHPR